jgi:Leucine-rich repeat (LRR) protein
VGVFLLALTTLATAVPLSAADADREVAVWVIHMGGFVVLEGDTRRIRDAAALPDGDFRIEVINMVGANMHPPHMEAFGKLTALKELHLPAPMWNPRADSTTDYNASTVYLVNLKTLKRLTFSLTFLTAVKFNDSGLDRLQPLGPTLEELVLRRVRMKGAGLKHFTNLRSLDLTWSYIEDKEMGVLAGMKRLRKFWARDTRIGETALQALGSLSELEEIDIGGADVSESGLANLSGLTRVKKLNLLGANITDAGLDSIAGMKDLEFLNLYRTKVSNAGLEKLKRFSKLREVDLRYSRATQAGVESLRAAMPSTELIFMDYSIKPAGVAGAGPQLAGKGDKAVADWIKSLGGSAALENGAVVEAKLSGTPVNDDLLKNLQSLRRLRKLDLDGTETGDLGVERLGGLTSLTDLSLNSTGISDAGLRHLTRLTNLRTLHLDNTLIEGSGLQHLKALKGLEELTFLGSPVRNDGTAVLPELRSLRKLSLAATDVSDDGLRNVGACTGLERLDLTSTDITDAGLEHLKGLTGITELVLDYSNRYTDKGFAHLTGLRNLRSLSLLRAPVTNESMKVVGAFTVLESLNLNYTSVGDEGLAALSKLSDLRVLGLDSTFVTDKSTALIAGFKKLQRLNLYHTLVTPAAQQELKSSLPGCDITWDENSARPNRRRS